MIACRQRVVPANCVGQPSHAHCQPAPADGAESCHNPHPASPGRLPARLEANAAAAPGRSSVVHREEGRVGVCAWLVRAGGCDESQGKFPPPFSPCPAAALWAGGQGP
eukprot:361064-Chlamydomonas_euryale.AAC.13